MRATCANGHSIERGYAFCPECGSAVNSGHVPERPRGEAREVAATADAAEQPGTGPPQPGGPPDGSKADAAPTPSGQSPSIVFTLPPEPSRRPRRRWPWLLGLTVCCLVALVTWLALFEHVPYPEEYERLAERCGIDTAHIDPVPLGDDYRYDGRTWVAYTSTDPSDPGYLLHPVPADANDPVFGLCPWTLPTGEADPQAALDEKRREAEQRAAETEAQIAPVRECAEEGYYWIDGITSGAASLNDLAFSLGSEDPRLELYTDAWRLYYTRAMQVGAEQAAGEAADLLWAACEQLIAAGQ